MNRRVETSSSSVPSEQRPESISTSELQCMEAFKIECCTLSSVSSVGIVTSFSDLLWRADNLFDGWMQIFAGCSPFLWPARAGRYSRHKVARSVEITGHCRVMSETIMFLTLERRTRQLSRPFSQRRGCPLSSQASCQLVRS